MKTNPEPRQPVPLLDTILHDEDWQATNAHFKAEALSAFRSHQRVRRLTRWSAVLSLIGLGILGSLHWPGRSPAPAPQPQLVRNAKPPQAPSPVQTLSDDQLLACFPKGSCILAVIDGRKELIFLDPKLEHLFIADSP
jgi:hypothetical protein